MARTAACTGTGGPRRKYTMNAEVPVLVLDTADTRRVAMILEWTEEGQQAHCLARLVLRPESELPVAILSELADNPRRLGLIGAMEIVASAYLARMRVYADLDPNQIVWIAHHGSFSSFDADGAPETFTHVELSYTNDHLFHDDLDDHHLLTPAQVFDRIDPLNLWPVPEVLSELRIVRI
jgi:hypothetical protein